MKIDGGNYICSGKNLNIIMNKDKVDKGIAPSYCLKKKDIEYDIKYNKEYDILTIDLKNRQGKYAYSDRYDDVIMDYSKDGNFLGVEIMHVKKFMKEDKYREDEI